NNTAGGANALLNNTTGFNNVAIGSRALFTSTSGNANIGLGQDAGFNLTTGSNNIEIGNVGAPTDDKGIRLGTQGRQMSTFVAGISGSAVSGAEVVVSGNGRLGVVVSSARYKHDIRDMGASTDRLMKLRPVQFQYRDDTAGITQYGLVAEEVEQVYPELVTRDTNGRVETVRYSMLTSMLLNELQKQHWELQEQRGENTPQT